MTVQLTHVEHVVGSQGDDHVSIGGELRSGHGSMRLGDGVDTLHLAEAGSYLLDLNDVEVVTGVSGAALKLRGKAVFETDGSIDIDADHPGAAKSVITFTDLVNDVTLSLWSRSKGSIVLDAGFIFTTNADGELVAVKDGRTLTFEGMTAANRTMSIIVDGQAYSYAELLASDLVDNAPPSVANVAASLVLITDSDVGASAFTVTVTFGEAMLSDGSADPVLSFDPDVASSLTVSGQSWNEAGTEFTVTYDVADAGVEVGAVTVGVTGARDLVLNLQQDYTAQVEFAVDTLNPTATAFTENNADGVVSDADNVVAYSVTFSEAVASLTADDLDIVGGSLTAGPVLAGDGLSATFSVTATDGSAGDLVVGLKDSIVDLNGNALVVPTPLTLAVDTLNPTVTAFTEDNADGVVSDDDNVVAFAVTFSEAVASLAAADLDITGGTLTTGPVLAGDGLSATFSVTATDGSTTDLMVGLKNSIVDINGNPLALPTPITLDVDTAEPTVTSMVRNTPSSLFTNADSLVWRVSFGEAVSQVDAADFTVSGTTATVTDVSAVSASVYDITLSGGDLAALNGDVTLAFSAGQTIVDLAGNALWSTTPTSTNQPTYKVDNEAPTVNLTNIAVSDWGYRFFGDNMATVNGEGSDSYPVTAAQIDWSKMWIEVDGSGSADITFTASDIASVDPTQGSFWFFLSDAKIAEINAAVDGTDDLIVVAEGFWGDLAGNVQLVGGAFSTTAVDIA